MESKGEKVVSPPPGYRPELVPPDMNLTPEGRPTRPL